MTALVWRFCLVLCFAANFTAIGLPTAAAIAPIANEAAFFALFDYAHNPGLAGVKAAIDAADYPHAKAELLSYMRGRTSVHYLFDALRQRALLLAERKVSASEISGAVADMNHVFRFQAETRDLGADINWRQGATEWSSVLNRWGWLLRMSWVYLQTQDEKYSSETIETIWIDWIEDNPLPAAVTTSMGEPWRALEVGYRCGTMLQIYHLLLGSPTMTPQNHYLILKCIAEHAIYLNDWCKNYHANNWQVAGASGLAMLSMIFPEFALSTTWQATALARVADHLNTDTSDEGWHREYAGGYHINCTRDYWLVFELARKNNLPIDPALYRRHRTMFDVLVRYRFPDKEFHGTGDSNYQGPPALSTLGMGVATYGDAEWRRDGTRPGVADVGLSGLQTFDQVPSQSITYKSFFDSIADFAVMRSDSGNTNVNPFSQMVLFDVNHDSIAHMHQDIGQIVYYAYNRYLFADAGSWLYGTPEHTTLTKAASHNVVLPGGNAISYSAGEVTEFQTAPGFDYARGAMNDVNNPTWVRQVLYVRPDYVVAVDRVNYQNNPTIQHRQYWHFPINSNLSLDPTNKSLKTAFATNYQNTSGTVFALPLHPEEISNAGFERALQRGPSGLGNSQRGWYEFSGAPAMRETVLLAQYPNTDVPCSAMLSAIDPSSKTREEASGMMLERLQGSSTTRDAILMNHASVDAPTTFGPYTTDARMAFMRMSGSSEDPSRLMVRQGRTVTRDGIALFSSPSPVADLDARILQTSSNPATLTLSANPSTASFTLYAPSVEMVFYNGQPWPMVKSGDFVTVDLICTATRLSMAPAGLMQAWINSVNRLRVSATDASGQIDARINGPVSLSASSPLALFSDNNFLTTTTQVLLRDGQGDFAFRGAEKGILRITVARPGLADATKADIFIDEPDPTPTPGPAQARAWWRLY